MLKKGGEKMIDTIKICLNTDESNLIKEKWTLSVIEETGEIYYCTFIDKIWLGFYPDTSNLIINGKFIGVVSYNRVDNFDDIYYSKEELEKFFEIFNQKLNKYFYKDVENILDAKVTRIDFCFNVYTEYVNEYISFFNRYYRDYRYKRFKKYVNYSVLHNLDMNSSFYLKLKNQYIDNKNQKYTINLYNKQHQLQTLRESDIEEHGKSSISEKEISLAKNILRLEVQLHHEKLKSICKKYNINWKTRTLRQFFNIDIAKDVVCNEVKRFFTNCDFYSYEYVKRIINEEGKCTKGMMEYIKKIATHNKPKSYGYYAKLLKNIGIFPYVFLSPSFHLEKLKNPIKLLEEKIERNNLVDLKL